MKKQEVLKFLQKIKIYYPNFNADSTLVKDEWMRKLEPYDFDDCYRKLDEHLEGEYQDRIPIPNWIIRFLKTSEEKKQSHNYQVVCPNCDRKISLSDFDDHICRCNASEYVIKEMKNCLGKEVNREQLDKLTNEIFWDKYDAMLEIIKHKLPEKSKRKKIIQAYFGEIDLSKDDIEKVVANSYKEEMEK